MASKYLLVLLIVVAVMITPSMGHFRKPSHHDHISPAPAEPEPEPEPEPPMPVHKPHHHKHHKGKPEPLVPVEPPQEGFFLPAHKPLPPYIEVPVYPPVESGEGPAPYMTPIHA